MQALPPGGSGAWRLLPGTSLGLWACLPFTAPCLQGGPASCRVTPRRGGLALLPASSHPTCRCLAASPRAAAARAGASPSQRSASLAALHPRVSHGTGQLGPEPQGLCCLVYRPVSDSRSWPHIVSLEPEAPLQGLQTSRSWSAMAPEPAAAGVGCPPRPTSSSPFTRNPVGPQWGPIRAPATCPPVHVRSLSVPSRAVQSIPSAA